MIRRAPFALAIALLAGCNREPAATAPLPSDFTPQSTSITLPPEPENLLAGAEHVQLNCTACHSGEMILAQPSLDAAKWQAEIDKMRGVFKASIDAKDDPVLIAELIALQKAPPRAK